MNRIYARSRAGHSIFFVTLSIIGTTGCTDKEPVTPVPTGPSADIVYPQEITAQGGVLEADMKVAYADNTLVERDIATDTITERKIHTRTYNGTIPGPTLRLKAGDRIDITLMNELPMNIDEHDTITEINYPHHANTTNLHTHGLHVDPTGDSDNVLREVHPGTTAAVAIDIPANHNPGTFWYHAHKHGSAMDQFLSGMWGTIIIEGDVDAVPEIAAAEDKVMVFGELGVDANGEVPAPTAMDKAAGPGDVFIKTRTFTINGIKNPIIRIRPGEVQRWRFINAATECNMDLRISGHQFHQIAADGVTYANVFTSDILDTTSGQRADFLIKGGDPGTYRIYAPMSMCDGDNPPSERDIATLIVEGDTMDMSLPAGPLPAPTTVLPDLTQLTPDRMETSQFSLLSPMVDNLQRTVIDGKSFNPSCMNKIFHRGELIEWTLTNISPVPHPFHIHTNSFQVLEVTGGQDSTGAPVPGMPYVMPFMPPTFPLPAWRDVVLIPATLNPMKPGMVKIRTRIEDFVGGLVLHCHVITHEELGMMQTVVVVDDTIPAADKVPAADIADVLADPATRNPNVPGYFVTENFQLCP